MNFHELREVEIFGSADGKDTIIKLDNGLLLCYRLTPNIRQENGKQIQKIEGVLVDTTVSENHNGYISFS